MALYMKQDFSPPIFSRRWIAMKFRPNMILYNREHILSILESGLLFREDCIEVEQEAPDACVVWAAAGGIRGGLMTRGERIAAVVAVAVAMAAWPPRSINRSLAFKLSIYACLPMAARALHRRMCAGAVGELVARMRDYLALARRTAACLKECVALRAQIASAASAMDSCRGLLCRQQAELSVLLTRASAALLGNAPWLRADVAWDAILRRHGDEDDLMKIHHAYLVVQSTLLKHIAMAHYIPSVQAQRMYKNHNERIYWIHTVLIPHLVDDFRENYEALERMYRLLKSYGNNDVAVNKRLGTAFSDNWLYSDVHNGVARANLELKLALDKCNNVDAFLDACGLNKQELDLEMLDKDLDSLIDCITKSLTSIQNSQIRLKKLRNKFVETEAKVAEEELIEDDREVLRIEDKEPETKDEVFYLLKTEDDDVVVQAVPDISTEPGEKEKETTKVVLSELKLKLVKREDVMRERERQALANTMPELKDKMPEFPRQMVEDVGERSKMSKTHINQQKRKTHRQYKRKPLKQKEDRSDRKFDNDSSSKDGTKSNISYEDSSNLVSEEVKDPGVKEWVNYAGRDGPKSNFSESSEGLSDVESNATNKAVNQAVNFNYNSKSSIKGSINDGESSRSSPANKNRNTEYNNRNPGPSKNCPEPDNRLLDSDSMDSDNENSVSQSSLPHFDKKSPRNVNKLLESDNKGPDPDRHTDTANNKAKEVEAVNYRFSKEDLELTPSSSDSEFESYEKKQALLKDVRKNRAARKKNYPGYKRASVDDPDEGLRPMPYRLGAGLALAAALRAAPRAGAGETVLTATGELTPDSGNDDE